MEPKLITLQSQQMSIESLTDVEGSPIAFSQLHLDEPLRIRQVHQRGGLHRTDVLADVVPVDRVLPVCDRVELGDLLSQPLTGCSGLLTALIGEAPERGVTLQEGARVQRVVALPTAIVSYTNRRSRRRVRGAMQFHFPPISGDQFGIFETPEFELTDISFALSVPHENAVEHSGVAGHRHGSIHLAQESLEILLRRLRCRGRIGRRGERGWIRPGGRSTDTRR
jgi:hypothetical protein